MNRGFNKKVSSILSVLLLSSTGIIGTSHAKDLGLGNFSNREKAALGCCMVGSFSVGVFLSAIISSIRIKHSETSLREDYDVELVNYKKRCEQLQQDLDNNKKVPEETIKNLKSTHKILIQKHETITANFGNEQKKSINDSENSKSGIPTPSSTMAVQNPPPPPPLAPPVQSIQSLCDKYKVKYQSPKPAAPRTTATVANIPPKGQAVSVVLLPRMRTSHVKSLSNEQLIKDYITNHPNFKLDSLGDVDLIRVKRVFDESKIRDFKECGALTNDVLVEKILNEGEFDTSKVDDIIECLDLYNKLSDKSNFEVDIDIANKKTILLRKLFNQEYIDATSKYCERFSSLHRLVDNDSADDDVRKILMDDFIKPSVVLFDKLTPDGLYEQLVSEKLNAFFNGITDVSKLKEIGTADAPSTLLKRFIDRSTKVADRLDKINSNELKDDFRTLIVHMFSTHNMSDDVISSLADAMVAANNS